MSPGPPKTLDETYLQRERDTHVDRDIERDTEVETETEKEGV